MSNAALAPRFGGGARAARRGHEVGRVRSERLAAARCGRGCRVGRRKRRLGLVAASPVLRRIAGDRNGGGDNGGGDDDDGNATTVATTALATATALMSAEANDGRETSYPRRTRRAPMLSNACQNDDDDGGRSEPIDEFLSPEPDELPIDPRMGPQQAPDFAPFWAGPRTKSPSKSDPMARSATPRQRSEDQTPRPRRHPAQPDEGMSGSKHEDVYRACFRFGRDPLPLATWNEASCADALPISNGPVRRLRRLHMFSWLRVRAMVTLAVQVTMAAKPVFFPTLDSGPSRSRDGFGRT